MKHTTITILAAVTFFSSTACGPESRTRVALYDYTTRRPTPKIDVFQPGEEPSKPFRKIAYLTAEGSAYEEASCIEGMIKKARKLGAEGLVILEAEAPSKSIMFKTGWIGPSPSDRVFKGNAIVYE